MSICRTIDNEYTDEQLCAQVAMGDRASEEALVLRYSRLVRICARPYFLVGGDGEDLIQEGMLGLLSAIREFSPDRNVAFRTYAELCIRRRMISAIRKAAGDKHTPLNTYVSLELTLFVGNQEYSSFGAAMGRQENPEDMIISRERLRSLVKWINDQLTELERSILQYYLKGFSYAEIAKEVDRSTKSVDNAVQRIRRKIARQIQSSEYSES
jgi:RNA polymerase sporulation-specific sigma factor